MRGEAQNDVPKWAGQRRPGWRFLRLKYLIADSRNGIWGDDADGGADDIACARVADFDRQRFCVRLPLQTFRKIGSEQLQGRVLERGDLLLEKSGGGERTSVGAVVQFQGEERAVCSNFIAVVRAATGVNARWLCYLNAHLYSAGVNRRSIKQTTGIQNLDSEQYFDEEVSVPPTSDQPEIAAYLDRETARIDALIEKKTRFIELLREKISVLVTRAITGADQKGQRRIAVGAEWLGEIPEHWSAAPAKYACSLVKDGTHLPPARVDDGVPLLSVRNIVDGAFIRRDDDSKISREDYLDLCRAFRPIPGDVLMAIVGATLGKTAAVPDGLGDFHIQRSLAVFRPRENTVDSIWLLCVLRSAGFQSLLWEHAGYSAQPGIYLGTLGDFSIPMPPLAEHLNP